MITSVLQRETVFLASGGTSRQHRTTCCSAATAKAFQYSRCLQSVQHGHHKQVRNRMQQSMSAVHSEQSTLQQTDTDRQMYFNMQQHLNCIAHFSFTPCSAHTHSTLHSTVPPPQLGHLHSCLKLHPISKMQSSMMPPAACCSSHIQWHICYTAHAAFIGLDHCSSVSR